MRADGTGGGEIYVGAEGSEKPNDLAREHSTPRNRCKGNPADPSGLYILDDVEKRDGAKRDKLCEDFVAAHESSVMCVGWSDVESGRCNDDAPIRR